ncbi:hypothetical protein Q4Q49_22000 [Shewanella sp. SP1S1-7]|uniref:hypothetical protein n=1 Tax=Shewanella sp. SP1S1-7 TaxID=3063536 RepID=UPI00288E7C3A|nr:hypothetical protein [Shewanella sp. SP1S1-7]MDT3337933.1 hypothetical protein [Shewanella sp. SP1S1-7]
MREAMRRPLPILLFLFTLQSNAEEFDLPVKISWQTEKGTVSREISSENIIEVSNAISEDRKNISFKLEVTAVVLDEASAQIAFIGYWCVVNRVGEFEYLSVSESDVISVSSNQVANFDCGNNFKVNVEWVNKSSKKDVLTHASS